MESSDKVTGPEVTTDEAARLLRLATHASVAVAGCLIVVKLAAWIYTDSVSLLSTLIDSLLDAVASLINLFAVRHALTPADREHRFGHGKAEPLAALGQTAFIAGSGLFLIFEAGHRLLDPRPVLHSEIGIAVMVFAIVVTLGLTRLQAYVVRKTGSVAIKADSLHYVGDILVNGAVIVALLLATELGWTIADPLFGLAIAGYIMFNAWQIARGSLDMLMDRELPEAERARIREIALGNPKVLDLHDLRTRSSGRRTFIQVHIEMDGNLSLYSAHAVADEVEEALQAAYPGAEVIIHQDPYGINEEHPRFR